MDRFDKLETKFYKLKPLLERYHFIVYKTPLQYNLKIEKDGYDLLVQKENVTYLSISSKGIILQQKNGNNLAIPLSEFEKINVLDKEK